MEEYIPSLEFNWNKHKRPWDKEDTNPAIEKVKEQAKKEEDMKAPEITEILETHLHTQGFLTTKERNYVGYNVAPFDLTAGDKKTLEIHGFEIKSDRDTFARLKDQLQEYSFICESIFLVLHKKDAPEWLPDWCGILRITKEGVYEERAANKRDPFDISTKYEWNALLKDNGLGKIQDRLKDMFEGIITIRKNILFNRYFSRMHYSEVEGKNFENFYPLTDKQKELIVGLDTPFHLKVLKREINQFEKRVMIIKKVINFGKSQSLK